MPRTSRTFRVFVSSTFSDLAEERNALAREVFPRLQTLCRQHGCHFQAIDLRWGIPAESGLNQQTMRICLDELARCQRASPKPNFVLLLGNRHGWRPLPGDIPVVVFERLVAHMPSREDRVLVDKWYRLDTNAVPALMVLQARSGEYVDERRWAEVEHRLRVLFDRTSVGLSAEERYRFESSATEQEIAAGALSQADAREHVFAFVREIQGLPTGRFDSPAAIGKYCDLVPDGETWKLDDFAAARLSDLKSALAGKLRGNAFTFQTPWRANSPALDHIPALCAQAYTSLAAVIVEEIARLESLGDLEREHIVQAEMRAAHLRHFLGREQPIAQALEYVGGDGRAPLVVHGPSGGGKSALLAKIGDECARRFPQAVVAHRFLGLTPASSHVMSLLLSLVEELRRLYDIPPSAPPSDLDELAHVFKRTLAQVPADRPLVLILDALDQLADDFSAQGLHWLPLDLPPHVKMIVSTLPGPALDAIKHQIPGQLIEITTLDRMEGKALLSQWLASSHRAVTGPQEELLLGAFSRCGLPLFLRIAFEEARNWHSYDQPKPFGADISALLNSFLDRLCSPTEHGELVVSRVLGLLAASRYGLTESELLDVLSDDEELLQGFEKQSFHGLPERRLPVVLWARLYADLEPFLMERNVDGLFVLGFFHRQFGALVSKRFLGEGIARSCHERLAAYFQKQSHESTSSNRAVAARKTRELPYQLALAHDWKGLGTCLTDLSFVAAKVEAQGVDDLLEDFERAEQHSAAWPEAHRVEDYRRFLVREASVLRRYPELAWQQALQQADRTAVATDAEQALAVARKQGIFRVLNKEALQTSVLWRHSDQDAAVSCCAVSADGQYLFLGTHSGRVRKIFPETGRVIVDVRVSGDELLALESTPDGRSLVAATSGQSLLELDLANLSIIRQRPMVSASEHLIPLAGGRGLVFASGSDLHLALDESASIFHGHGATVTDLCRSNDGARFASCSRDETVSVFDAATQKPRWSSGANFDSVFGCSFSPCGRFVVSCSSEQLLLHDAETGTTLGRYELGSGAIRCVRCLAVQQGALPVICCGDDGLVRELELMLPVSTGAATPSQTAGSSAQFRVTREIDLHEGPLRACFSIAAQRLLIVFSVSGAVIALALSQGIQSGQRRIADAVLTGTSWSGRGLALLGTAEGEVVAHDGAIGHVLKAHSDAVYGIGILPSHTAFVTVGADRTLALWDARTQRLLSRPDSPHRSAIRALCVDPTEEFAVTAGEDGRLVRWTFVRNGISLPRPSGLVAIPTELTVQASLPFIAVVLRPGGGHLIAADPNSLSVWALPRGNRVWSGEHHIGRIRSLLYEENARRILAVSSDGTVGIWDDDLAHGKLTPVATPRAIGQQGIAQATLLAAGSHLVTGGRDGELGIWSCPSLTRLGRQVIGSPVSAVFRGFAEDELLVGTSWGEVWRVQWGAPSNTCGMPSP